MNGATRLRGLGLAWLACSRVFEGFALPLDILLRSRFVEEQLNHFKWTRSQRSSSSSNETSSPTEKRSKSDKVDLDRSEVLSKVDFVMTNTSDNPDKLNLILKKLEKLDAIELTLRDMASRISKNESAVETLQSETRKMTSSINEMNAWLSTLNQWRIIWATK